MTRERIVHMNSRLQHPQRGVTLVELMVAIFLMLLVTMATVALYSVNSSSKRTIDASQALDDTARYVFELIGQAARDAGYPGAIPDENAAGTARTTLVNLFDDCELNASSTPCPVLGFDNAKVGSSGYGESAGADGINDSDSLALRFNGAPESASGGTVLSCAGTTVVPANKEEELGLSIFWVKMHKGEPELYCNYLSAAGTPQSEPVARGIESFQVMYAVDCQGSPCDSDGIPDRWVSASDVQAAEWRNIRAVRVGLIVRGPIGSSQAASGDDLYPLGEKFSSGSSESGLTFTPPDDRRLRRVYTTTFVLRNST